MKKYVINSKQILIGIGILIAILCTLYGIMYIVAEYKNHFQNKSITLLTANDFDYFVKHFNVNTVVTALGITLKRLGISLFIAVILGLFFGFLLCRKKQWTYTQPTADFLRSIPVTFFIPVMAIVFGSGNETNLYIYTIYPTSLIIMFGVRTGLMKQDLERAHFFKIISSDNCKSKLENWKLAFFEALPDIFSQFRVALSYGLVIVTVIEYLEKTGGMGIGYLAYKTEETVDKVGTFFIILLIGVVGFVLNKITEMIQHKWIHWSNENLKNEN
jgi:ABC-type nitrate/sulfonate/bicarbonate transport system permease component